MIGSLPYFYPEVTNTDWHVYFEQAEQFFKINELSEEKKKGMLLMSLSDPTYKKLRDVYYPSPLKSKTYEELIEQLSKQHIVRTSVFRGRIKFYTAKQYATESISDWFVRVKQLSIDCKFANNFDDVILDRFISGLRPSPVLDRLCEEEDTLTLKQAVEIAVIKESSLKGSSKGHEDAELQQQYKNRRSRKKKNMKKLYED